AVLLGADQLEPWTLHEQVLTAYEALGYPRHIVGTWAISDNDVEDFVRLAVAADPRKILEVGTFVGVSTMMLALACPKARIFTVDPDFLLAGEMSSAGSVVDGVDPSVTTFDVARRVAARLGVLDRIEFVRGGFAVGDTFSSFLHKDGATIEVVGPKLCREEGPFDFAFVDGLHSAEAVAADLNLVATAVDVAATVVLHDCIGFWGASVRSGVHAFLRGHPDYAFSHPRYAEVYKSIGVLKRRSDGASPVGTVRRPFRTGDVPPLAVQALARLTADMVGPRPIVELTFGAPLLDAAYDGHDYSWLPLEQPAAVTAALKKAKGAAVFSAELLDFAPTPLLADIFHTALKRGSPLVLAMTPPGEEGVAGPESRPIAAVVDLAEQAGGVVYAPPALDIESERYALLPQPPKLGETSLFTSFMVVAAPGGFLDARHRHLLRLSADAASEREQLELQRIHLAAGYRRYYDDWRRTDAKIPALGALLQQTQQEAEEAKAGRAVALSDVRDITSRFTEVSSRFTEVSSRLTELAGSLVELDRQRVEAMAQASNLSLELAAKQAKLEESEARRESLLTTAIEVFEAVDALDAGIADQVQALSPFATDPPPSAPHMRHDEDPDLLDADKIASELASMRANAKWIAGQTLDMAAANAALLADNTALKDALQQILSSTSWRVTAPARGVRSGLGGLANFTRLARASARGRKLVALQTKLNQELASTGAEAVVFDADWYANFYGDVPADKALRHYLMFGEDEGRRPHPKFDPSFYRALYPDVSASKDSPLLHFLTFGLGEGRSPSETMHPLGDKARAAAQSPLQYYATAPAPAV
ncbi:MAG TPA: class I SAM-dependent methyltransferase, partial [Phenylobacterium sp.]|nr:class I SAM-dependent methyltransferase [Phenylobacterium sp.]